jgi:hypothetical protein
MFVPDELLKADGFDEAVLGLAERGTVPPVVAYDYEKCVEILMDGSGMTRIDAVEYMNFNVVGSWVGELTPVFVHKMSIDDLEEMMPTGSPGHTRMFSPEKENPDAGSATTPENA